MSLIFICGGVRSGKSSLAEKWMRSTANNTSGKMHYIATSVPTDLEMEERIKKHQDDRIGDGWQTWELDRNPGKIAHKLALEDVVLLDCLTTWLGNELFHRKKNDIALMEHMLEEVLSLTEASHTLCIVSNDVFSDLPVQSEFVFTYQKALGHLHQHIVARADVAVQVECGIPLMWKGESPCFM